MMKRVTSLYLATVLASTLFACSPEPVDSPTFTPTPVASVPTPTQTVYGQDVLWRDEPGTILSLDEWEADIRALCDGLKENHANTFHKISEEDFFALGEALIAKLPKLNYAEILCGMEAIVAAVGEGHTQLYMPDDSKFDVKTFPVSFYVFDDGVYVTNIDKTYSWALYAKVVAVNGTEIEKVRKALANVMSSDNEIRDNHQLPLHLKTPLYLFGLGIIPNLQKAVFTFENENGERFDEVLDVAVSTEMCVNSEDISELPLSSQNPERNYRYEVLDEQNAIYFQYRQCIEMSDEPIVEFIDDLLESIEDTEPKTLIIDLRQNNGGDSSLITPFTGQLREYMSEHAEMTLYVLVGRRTFSSGIFAIADFLKIRGAVFVGEPTSEPLNHFGAVGEFYLPNSRLPVSYSQSYFLISADDSDRFTPDLLMPPVLSDVQENRDSVLEKLLEERPTLSNPRRIKFIEATSIHKKAAQLPQILQDGGYMPAEIAGLLTEYRITTSSTPDVRYHMWTSRTHPGLTLYCPTSEYKVYDEHFYAFKLLYDETLPKPSSPMSSNDEADMAARFVHEFCPQAVKPPKPDESLSDERRHIWSVEYISLFSGNPERVFYVEIDVELGAVTECYDITPHYLENPSAYADFTFTASAPLFDPSDKIKTAYYLYRLRYDLPLCGVEYSREEYMNNIENTRLISSEEVEGFPFRVVYRVFERDYPYELTERTGTYTELRAAVVMEDGTAYDFWVNGAFASRKVLLAQLNSIVFEKLEIPDDLPFRMYQNWNEERVNENRTEYPKVAEPY